MKQLSLFPYICHCGGEIDYHQVRRPKNVMDGEVTKLVVTIVRYKVCLRCFEAEFLDEKEGI